MFCPVSLGISKLFPQLEAKLLKSKNFIFCFVLWAWYYILIQRVCPKLLVTICVLENLKRSSILSLSLPSSTPCCYFHLCMMMVIAKVTRNISKLNVLPWRYTIKMGNPVKFLGFQFSKVPWWRKERGLREKRDGKG